MPSSTEPLEAERPPSSPAPPEPVGNAAPPAVDRRADALEDALALLPALLLVFFAFNAGGFYAGSTGVAACALAGLLALRATLAHRPFAALNGPVALVAGALAAYAAWTLVSVAWSSAPGRAVVEFNRTLLYGLAFVTCATVPWTRERLALAVRALALVVAGICLVGWLSRVLPEVVAPRPGAAPDRLSHPLTYWNAQGLIAAIGVVLCAHLAISGHERRGVRLLGAAAVPMLASTLYFTFSRGAILAVFIGLVAYVVLYRSRGLIAGALVLVAPTVIALTVSYDADRLATNVAYDAAAVAQGHDVARVVAICCVAALWLRLCCDRWLERRVDAVALPPRARRPARLAGAVALVLAFGVLPVALGAPAWAERQVERFVENDGTPETDQRSRILNPGNNGRLDQWRVGVDAWRANPVTGTGAGTYEWQWERDRELNLSVIDAHSLYVETLSDLGLVGFLTLMTALLAIVGGALWRGRRHRRAREVDPSLAAAVVAAMVVWLVHAGLDWMWEMPGVTIWLFALGGIALAARAAPDAAPRAPWPGRTARIAIGLMCLALAVVPFQVARSQGALDDAVRAYFASPQDCPLAIDRALTSLSAVGARAEPWEIIAYCDIGVGQPGLAVQAAQNAVARDPGKWEYRYGLGVVKAVTGRDPLPDMRRAQRMNPKAVLPDRAIEAFEKAGPRGRARVARRLTLPG